MGEQGKISVRKVSGGSVGSPRKSRGLIAGVVVVLFGVAMMFFFWLEEAAVIEPEEKPVEKPKVMTPISVAEEPTERELTRDEILAKQREARRAAAEAKKAELEGIVESTSAEEKRLMSKREACAAKIDARTMSAYERIRNSVHNRLAVVGVYNENACGGCFNTITPQRLLDIASNNKLVICEHCGRIIVNKDFDNE